MRPITVIAALSQRRHLGVIFGGVGDGVFRGSLLWVDKATKILCVSDNHWQRFFSSFARRN